MSIVIDWERIISLKDGDTPEENEWLEGMIRTVIENMGVRITQIRGFIDGKKDQELLAELHKVKGVAGNFGLELLRQRVTDAESRMKQGNTDLAYDTLKDIEEVWSSTKKELGEKFK